MRDRVSERERERAVGKLQRGYACGALGTETLEWRLESALSTESPWRLSRVTVDLERSLLERVRSWLEPAEAVRPSTGLLRGLGTGRPRVVGRSSKCDVVLSDESVSRRHAMIARQGQLVVVTDLGSTNGTFLNGRWVAHAEVRPGDHLQLGDVQFWL